MFHVQVFAHLQPCYIFIRKDIVNYKSILELISSSITDDREPIRQSVQAWQDNPGGHGNPHPHPR